jgi:AbrB family looped-hinge helix DNA binding protein
MAHQETTRVGKRGTVVLPAKLRHQFGLEEGAPIIAEANEDGILLRPAATVPLEAGNHSHLLKLSPSFRPAGPAPRSNRCPW